MHQVLLDTIKHRDRSNNAFENGRADQQRALGLRSRRRAAQRERYAIKGKAHTEP